MVKVNGFDQFYSRMLKGDGVEYFVDKNGLPTTNRPHVHVVHHGSGRVDVIATDKDGKHIWRTELNNPSGNEVNSAVANGRGRL